jgi:hypothetical protein
MMQRRLDVFIKMAMAQGQGYICAPCIFENLFAPRAQRCKRLWRCDEP